MPSHSKYVRKTPAKNKALPEPMTPGEVEDLIRRVQNNLYGHTVSCLQLRRSREARLNRILARRNGK